MAVKPHPSWLGVHILTELKARPMSAKELREELTGKFRTLSPGTFYPAMQRMVQEGLVSKAPLPLKVPGRRQSVYSITRAGEEELESVTRLLLSNLHEKIWDLLEEDERSALPATEGATVLVGWRGGASRVLELARMVGPNGRIFSLRLPGTVHGPLKRIDGDIAMPEIRELELKGGAIPLREWSMDQVVLGGVLSTVEDKGALMAEVHRVLRSEGVLVLQEVEPTDHAVFSLWLKFSGLDEGFYPTDLRSMEALARTLMFDVLKTTSRNGVVRLVAIKPARM